MRRHCRRNGFLAMAYFCPNTGLRLAKLLKIHTELGEWLENCQPSEAIVQDLRQGLMVGAGSMRCITHLIKIEPDARKMAGTLPRPPRTCTQENLEGWRCWTHTGAALTWTMNTEQVARAGSVKGSQR